MKAGSDKLPPNLSNGPVNVKPQGRGTGHTPGGLTFCL